MNTKAKLYSKSLSMNETEHAELLEISRIERLSQTALLHRWIREGIIHYKRSKAVEGYRHRHLTLSEAAELADLPVREMMRALVHEGIPILHTDESFDTAIRTLAGHYDAPGLVDILEQIRMAEAPQN